MDSGVRISNLFLGMADGTSEARKENFEELFFDPNNKYEELMSSQEKYLIIGRKGTGKTYLANYVVKKSSENKKDYAFIVESMDFLVQKLNTVHLERIDDEIIYAFCRWYLLYQLGIHIIETHSIRSRLVLTRIAKLRQFLSNFDNDDIFRIMKRICSSEEEKSADFGIKDFSEISSANYISKATNAIKYESDRKAFYENIPALERKVFNAICKDEKYTIIIDDLDELDNTQGNKGSIILGLIKVAKEYNLRKGKNNVKFILLLRSEIVDDLQYKDANLSKTKLTCGVELYWLSDFVGGKQYNHPLMNMMFYKIRAYSVTYSKWTNEQLYNKLFPESIDNKTPLNYLLDYGMGRPRDFVNYLNCAKSMAGDLEFFSAKLLKEASKAYSAVFYDEMINQSAYYGKPDYTRQCMQLLSSLKSKSFSYEDIKNCFLMNNDSYGLITDLDDALRFLYILGAIGNVWKGEKNKTICTGWSYKKEAMNEVDLSKKFTIHYGLRKKFSL